MVAFPNISAYDSRVMPVPRRVYFMDSATIRNGQVVHFDVADSESSDRASRVTQCTWANMEFPAGIVVNCTGGSFAGPGEIDVIPISGDGIMEVNVYTDENIAVGDLLGSIPGQYHVGKSVVTKPYFRATAAQNRSVTNGTVLGELRKLEWDADPTKLSRYFCDFLGDQPIVLGGFTPAEILCAGMEVTGASVAAAYGSGSGDTKGHLIITPNGTTIGQLHAGAANFPYLLSTGRALFFRTRVKTGIGAVDNAFFAGLAITGAAVSNGAVPALDDYLGFFIKVDDDGSIHLATNRDNGTDNLSDTAVNSAADTWVDLAFYVCNKVAGDAANSRRILVFVNGTLTNTLTTAAICALTNVDEAMRWVIAGIDGAAAVVMHIDRVEVNYHL